MTISRAIPILNLPNLYINNLVVKNDPLVTTLAANNTLLYVEPGQCRDSTNTYDMVLDVETQLNAANNGLNGLDEGDLAADTIYNIFLISDPVNANVPGVMASLAEIPLMPFGYSAFRKIGYWTTATSGTARWDLAYISGLNAERFYTYQNHQNVLGAQPGATTPVAVDLGTRVPLLENVITYASLAFANNTTANTSVVSINIYGSDPTSFTETVFCQVNNVAIGDQVMFPSKLNITVPTAPVATVNVVTNAATATVDLFINAFAFSL